MITNQLLYHLTKAAHLIFLIISVPFKSYIRSDYLRLLKLIYYVLTLLVLLLTPRLRT